MGHFAHILPLANSTDFLTGNVQIFIMVIPVPLVQWGFHTEGTMQKAFSSLLVRIRMEFAFKGITGGFNETKKESLCEPSGLLTPHMFSTMSKDKFEGSQELELCPPIGASTSLFFDLKQKSFVQP